MRARGLQASGVWAVNAIADWRRGGTNRGASEMLLARGTTTRQPDSILSSPVQPAYKQLLRLHVCYLHCIPLRHSDSPRDNTLPKQHRDAPNLAVMMPR